MNLQINTSFNGNYYIINKDIIDEYYNKLYDIIEKYQFYNDIFILIYNYQFINLSQLDYKNINNLYNNKIDIINNIINNYQFNIQKNNNNIYLNLFNLNIIDKYFSSYYEIFIKYDKYFKILFNNNIDILELSNTTFAYESFFYYNKISNNNFNYDIYVPYFNDKELISRLINIKSIYNNNITILGNNIDYLNNYFNIDKHININKKYKIIFNSCRPNNIYKYSIYSNFSSNKMIIYYLIKSLLVLEQDGCLIIRYYNYQTQIQKEIYYLFRKLFKKTKLFIPQSSQLYSLTAGFIIGFNFIGLDKDLTNKLSNLLQELLLLNDQIYINFDPIFQKFQKFKHKLYINFNNKKFTKYPGLYSFYNIQDNNDYNNKLSKYFNKYMSKVLFDFSNINHNVKFLYDKISFNISKSILWVNTFLSFNISPFNKFLSDYISIISNKILSYNKNKCYLYNLKTSYKKILSFDNLINNMINQNNRVNIYDRYLNLYNKSNINKLLIKYYFHNFTNHKYDYYILYEILNKFNILHNDFILINDNNSYIESLNKYFNNKIKYHNYNNINDIKNINKETIIYNSIDINIDYEILLYLINNKCNGIIKIQYPLNNEKIIIMIGLIRKFYKESYIYKSKINYHYNEFYLICKDFNNDINIQINDYNIDLIDDSFYYKFYKIYTKLIKIMIRSYKFKIFILDRYDIIKDNKKLDDNIINIRKKNENIWLNIYKKIDI